MFLFKKNYIVILLLFTVLVIASWGIAYSMLAQSCKVKHINFTKSYVDNVSNIISAFNNKSDSETIETILSNAKMGRLGSMYSNENISLFVVYKKEEFSNYRVAELKKDTRNDIKEIVALLASKGIIESKETTMGNLYLYSKSISHSGDIILIGATDYDSALDKLFAQLNIIFSISLAIAIGLAAALHNYFERLILNTRKIAVEEGIYSGLIEETDDHVSYITKDFKYKVVSNGYCKTFNMKKEDIIGLTIADLIGKENFEKNIRGHLEAALSGKQVNFDSVMYLEGVGYRFMMVNYTPHYVDGAIEGVIAVIKDVTELKETRDDLLEKTKELEKLNSQLESKIKTELEKRIKQERYIFEQKKLADMGHMVNAIAHQWRQPLNALSLYIQAVNMRHRENKIDQPFMDDFMLTCENLILHMSETIDDFRDFFAPRKEETDFQVLQAVQESVSLVEAQLFNNNIKYKLRYMDKDNPFEYTDAVSLKRDMENLHPEKAIVRGYPSELKQVVLNIIQNSQDAIKEKKKKGLIDIDISVSGNFVKITIKDNAGGIPEDVLPKIFDPYFTTKEEGKGTGIGLYMSKVIIESHLNGKISCYNEDGAVFRITLPKV